MTIPHLSRRLAAVFLVAAGGTPLAALAETAPAAAEAPAPSAGTADEVGEVVITARHRSEDVEKAPVAVSVLGGDFLAKTDTINIQEVALLEPTIQFSFFNARNANINIRGLGNNIGLASDGLEPGVGFYVDQVYYDRPATATFDLPDLSQIEVLRGPQGTLFGKNSTAGAINISTSRPTFTPEATGEVTGGNYGDFQAKASVSGPIIDNVLAARLSVSTDTHQGYLTNTNARGDVNDARSLTFRGQLLYTPNSNFKLRLIADYGKQDSNCCDLALAGVVSPPNGKNFYTLSEAFGYKPAVDPFDRQADTNSPIHANQETGGISAEADWTVPGVILTSVSSWRFWNWWPANDSDYTPLSVLTLSQNGDYQKQYSQEFRIASTGSRRVDFVGGLYLFHEEIDAVGATQYGNAASAFLLGSTVPSAAANGYTLNFTGKYNTTSYAAFGQSVWHITSKWNLTTGLRYTYDDKHGTFDQIASGGASLAAYPAAVQSALLAARAALGTSDYFQVATKQGDLSGQADLSYQVTSSVLTYVNYARGYKSGGLNLVQLPAGVDPVVAPESVDSVEAGVKTRLWDRRVTLNADLFWERDRNYQANIYDPTLFKQYLANVPEVRSEGLEADINAEPLPYLSLYASGSYDDAIYASYADGICGLENITQTHCNLSGAPLAGTPRWAAAAGGEIRHAFDVTPRGAEAYLGMDYSFRSSIYSAATDSIYSRLGDLDLVNARLGLRSSNGRWDAYLWARNLFNQNYFTFVAAGVGNTGALFGQLGDPRTYGVTLRAKY